jgi:hypothetical protein
VTELKALDTVKMLLDSGNRNGLFAAKLQKEKEVEFNLFTFDDEERIGFKRFSDSEENDMRLADLDGA